MAVTVIAWGAAVVGGLIATVLGLGLFFQLTGRIGHRGRYSGYGDIAALLIGTPILVLSALLCLFDTFVLLDHAWAVVALEILFWTAAAVSLGIGAWNNWPVLFIVGAVPGILALTMRLA